MKRVLRERTFTHDVEDGYEQNVWTTLEDGLFDFIECATSGKCRASEEVTWRSSSGCRWFIFDRTNTVGDLSDIGYYAKIVRIRFA